MLNELNRLIEALNGFSHQSKSLVTLASVIGFLIILNYAIRFILAFYKDVRLYFINQIWCSIDYRSKYGKWAVVSGATDGIGLAMAKDLARRGMSIVVLGRNEEKLAKTKLALAEEPNVGEIVTVKIDLADSSVENYERMRREIDPDNRDIGVFINSAGIIMLNFAQLHEFSTEQLRDMVNVNILAAVFLTRIILTGMIGRRRGLIMNVSSALSGISCPYMALYSPGKMFMNAFYRNLQIEYAAQPIDIVTLNPGSMQTKLYEGSINISKIKLHLTSPDSFVRTCLNALATPYETFCGCLYHEYLMRLVTFVDYLGGAQFVMTAYLKLFAKNAKLSPLMKRRQKFKHVHLS